MSTPLIYVAGPLNDDSCGYIQNLSNMNKEALLLKKNGFAVYIPGNDIILGLLAGNFTYEDYFDNSIEIMKKCDGIYFCNGWETSDGCKKEMFIATNLTIPYFSNINDLKVFYGK